MGSARFSSLVVAPTMRVPGDVRGTINAYLALRAALVPILDHDASGAGRVAGVAVPGLCTGVGWMPAEESAHEMWAAHDMIVRDGWKGVVHPALAPFALRPSRDR